MIDCVDWSKDLNHCCWKMAQKPLRKRDNCYSFPTQFCHVVRHNSYLLCLQPCASCPMVISATTKLSMVSDSTSFLRSSFFFCSSKASCSLFLLKNCFRVIFLLLMLVSSSSLTPISWASLSCCRSRSSRDCSASMAACASPIYSLRHSNSSQQLRALHYLSQATPSFTCGVSRMGIRCCAVRARWAQRAGRVFEQRIFVVRRYSSLLSASRYTSFFRLMRAMRCPLINFLKGSTWSLIATAISAFLASSPLIAGNASSYLCSMRQQGKVGSLYSLLLRSGSVEVRKSWNSSDMKMKFSFTQLLRKYERYLMRQFTTRRELLPDACFAGRQGIITPGQRRTNTSRNAANSLQRRQTVIWDGQRIFITQLMQEPRP